MMLDISVIILTYNEEIHIRRCLENVKSFASEIFLVDSYSSDKTVEFAKEMGVSVYQNKWENNHAKQFNWGLNNLPIKTKWVLRLDADEYLTPESIDELINRINSLPDNITGCVLKRRHIFLGKWIKNGTYPVKLLRLFQYGKGVCEQRIMDEHIQLLEGNTIEFEYDFVDHNLNNLSWWILKHNGYAIKEAAELLDIEFNFTGNQYNKENVDLGEQASLKRSKKHKYAKMPLFWRSFLYFILRYFVNGGFLEGKEGFLWHFLQGWWYRTLVDAKIFEIKKACGNDKDKIITYLKEQYNIDCSK